MELNVQNRIIAIDKIIYENFFGMFYIKTLSRQPMYAQNIFSFVSAHKVTNELNFISRVHCLWTEVSACTA